MTTGPGGAYDTPTGCSGGPAPGATALMQQALKNFPGVTSGGIYSCRKTRTGSGFSEHAEGRAVDLMVRSRTLGDKLASWAIRIPGVQTVIWHDQVWTSTRPNWRPYGDAAGRPFSDPTLGHRDHVHVGLTRAAAGSSSTGSGIPVIGNIAGGLGNGVAGLGGDLVSSAVDPLLEQLHKLLVTGAIVTLGMALLVSGGYRAVTGRRLAGDATQAAGTVAKEAATTYATGGAGKAATATKAKASPTTSRSKRR